MRLPSRLPHRSSRAREGRDRRKIPSGYLCARAFDVRVLRARLTLLVAAACALSLVAWLRINPATGAYADQSTISVTELPSNPHSSDGEGTFIRVSGPTSSVAYCAQGWLLTPEVGQHLERYGSLEIPELDYVMYHGYDGKVVTSVYGLDEQRSEAATAAAVWLAIADQRGDILDYVGDGEHFHGNQMYLERWQLIKDEQVKEAAWKLYQAGLDYKRAGAGGDEAGCATLWTNKTTHDQTGLFEYQCLVTSDKVVTATFTKTSADVKITEGNESYSLAGASYDIYRTSDDRKVASIETDEDGHASLQLEPNTSYYAVETSAPNGFLVNEQRVEFKTGTQPSDVELSDTPARFSLVVSKRDAATRGIAQPGATLEGAEFHLTSLSVDGFERSGTTDEHGVLEFEDLPLGTVRVMETKAPEGYVLDPTPHEYTVETGDLSETGELTLMPEEDYLEVPVAFDLEIAKFRGDIEPGGSDHETPAEGVEFLVISNTTGKTVGSIITGSDGYATTEGLWFGEGERPENAAGALPYDRAGYLIRENKETTPDGLKPLDDWTIEANQMANGATVRYIVSNQAVMARLQIAKIDADTGERIAAAGFSFQILDEHGEPISQNAWYPNPVTTDVFTTDESGTVTLPELLRAGSYRVREVAAPAPYLLGNEDVTFTIEDESDGALVVVEVADRQATGSARLAKTCSQDGKALAGATFDVVALQDVIGPDGSILAAEGSIVGTVTTDEEGTAHIEGLPLAADTVRYAFVETEAPDGHVLDTSPIEFSLSFQDGETPTVVTEVSTTNEPTRVVVHKRVCGNPDEGVEGVEFTLWRADDEAEGSEEVDGVPKLVDGREALTVETDAQGDAIVEHLEQGTWRMKETGAPQGLIPSDEVFEFTVDDQGLIEGERSFEVTMENDYTKVDISKRDITNEEEVPGAHLTILDEDGNAVESWVSGTEPHRIEQLAPGTYYLIEELAPQTHEQASAIEFTVDATGEVQTVVMYDQPISIEGTVDKRQEVVGPADGDDEPSGNDGSNDSTSADRSYAYSIDIRNGSTTWVDEFTVTDEIDGAEAGLVELTALTTPQASGDFDGKLNVWYRTNLPADTVKDSSANATLDDGHGNPWLAHDSVMASLGSDGRALDYTGWRLWCEGVSTEQAVRLDVADLDLRDDEKVVAIRLEYGCVDAGFCTRSERWEADGIKDVHDNVETVAATHEGDTFESTAGEMTERAPLVMHMRVTDRYQPGDELTNDAHVDLYRNGGREELEDHDEDHVEQVHDSGIWPLDQTGVGAGVAVILVAASGAVWWFARTRESRAA